MDLISVYLVVILFQAQPCMYMMRGPPGSIVRATDSMQTHLAGVHGLLAWCYPYIFKFFVCVCVCVCARTCTVCDTCLGVQLLDLPWKNGSVKRCARDIIGAACCIEIGDTCQMKTRYQLDLCSSP